MLDFSIKFVSSSQALVSLAARLNTVLVLALDIETVNWWDRKVERVSLIQLAFREEGQIRAAVVDVLDGLSLEDLRPSLESNLVIKAIHNAAYDATRLLRHFCIHTSPIHDTMLAARHRGEKRYSLQAQAEIHLGLRLDKSEQRCDWSRRPLSLKQLRYAALDAVSTLLLYESQLTRGLAANYQLREVNQSTQTSLPLSDAADLQRLTSEPMEVTQAAKTEEHGVERLSPASIALLGVACELAGRYIPERLAVSAGSERVGLTGWVIDNVLGAETDMDEDMAKQVIAELLEMGLVGLNEARRLEPTEAGVRLWAQLKPS